MLFAIESLSSTDPSSCRSHWPQDTGLKTCIVSMYQFMVSEVVKSNLLTRIFAVFHWFENRNIPRMIRHFVGTFSGVCGRFHGPFANCLDQFWRPYCAVFLLDFCRVLQCNFWGSLEEMCHFRLCLTVFADSVYFYSFASRNLLHSGGFKWIYVVFCLTIDMNGVLWCYSGLFWTIWCIWEDVLCIFSTERRIWWQNQVGTKESSQTEAKPGLWARVKAQWATQQCSSSLAQLLHSLLGPRHPASSSIQPTQAQPST